MAAAETASPDAIVSANIVSSYESVKESSLDSLMDRLRAKAGQYRSWPEMSKQLRVAVNEKRHLMNCSDRTQLQKVLDTLQKSIKVTSLQSMLERLESISRQVQGVRFLAKSATEAKNTTEAYIFNDNFYVEIVLEPTGAVKDVKINHGAEPSVNMTCSELIKVLKNGNFSEFSKHMAGLASIYQLNGERDQKNHAFQALKALETDLAMLTQYKSSTTEPRNLVNNSPVGILQKRQGGYPLKLTYFISPYDLLDVETKTSIPLTAETVIEKGLGQSVTVCIESSTAHKLQTSSLLTEIKPADARGIPQFAALSNLNSQILPANFVLKLPKAIPMAISLVKDIQNVTKAKIPDCGDLSLAQPLLSVIINDTSNGKLSAGDHGLWVTLPDQHHCYFLNSSSDLQGVMVSSIPFTHPIHVPQILVFLRQQMLFNTVISSCIRPKSKKDAESPFMFEGMAYSTSHILVSFEHPLEESLATVDIDLKDINKVSCKIYTLSSDANMCTDDYASKVLQRCLSIPITMRAVIRKAQGQQQLMRSSNQGDAYCATVNNGGSVSYLSHIPNYENSLTNGSTFSGGDFSNLASRMCNKTCDGSNSGKMTKNVLTGHSSENQNFPHSNSESSNFNPHDSEADSSTSNPPNPNYAEKQKGCSTLLQNTDSNSSGQYQHSNRQSNKMLMSMLSDIPEASSSFPFLGHTENASGVSSKSRKRKRRSDNRSSTHSTGRSPKRKLSEDEYGRGQSTPDGEICDSPLAYEACSSLPASLPSTAEQHLDHHVGSVESLVKAEAPSSGFPPQRSASTDSYLMHEDFHSRRMLNVSDSSHLSEGGVSSNPEVVRNFSLVKTEYFGSETINDIKNYLATDASSYGDPMSGDMDVDDDNSFSLDSNSSSAMAPNPNVLEKPTKKKKYKEKCDNLDLNALKGHENVSSDDDSSIGDISQKSFGEAENSQSEDSSMSSKSSTSHTTQPIFLGTSLKIAKSGDTHKISKSDSKTKQRDSKKSNSEGSESSGRKKSDAKKEKKRRKAENSGSTSRSPVRPIHLNIDSSLMPPPSSTSETASSISSSDSQPIRPITLNVKNSPVVSNFQAKSPVYSKKSSSLSSTSSNPSKSSSSKSGSSEKSVKPSPPRSSHVSSLKVSSSNSDSKKSSGTATVKIQSKHKQSSSSKSSSSSSGSAHSSGRSSPNKVKSATLKFKSYPSTPSVTLTPIVTKVSSSPTSMSQVPSSESLMMQMSVLNPPSPTGKSGSGNSKSNKAVVRSRSLSAVIDKLKTSATNAQSTVPDGIDGIKGESGMRSEVTGERKDYKQERKDNSKDGLLSKGSEGKSKYSSSEQFTVKQSSQGIKLTVTKTRSGEGSSKSSKSKQSAKVSTNSNVSKSGSSAPKSGNVSPASKKLYPPTTAGVPSKSMSSAGNQPKQPSTTSQKISSPSHSSSMSPRTSSSANNLSKSMSKHITSSSQSKMSGSASKVFDKADKKVFNELKSSASSDMKDIAGSNMNAIASLMPPPSFSKPASDLSRTISASSAPKRTEENSRQSPRHTPTRDSMVDESDGERAFRILLQKSDPAIVLEQGNLSHRSIQIMPAPVDYSKDYSKLDISKIDMEDKGQWVSSTSDIKTPTLQCTAMKHMQDQRTMEEVNCMPMNEIDCRLNDQMEVSSSNLLNANIVSSSEELGKAECSRDDDSSPEECLVIDCDDDKWSSRCIKSNLVLNVLDDKLDKSEMSPGTFGLPQPSLIKSPAHLLTAANHSLPQPNSYSMEHDDLMNEAVMPIKK